jgi:hypothetical protein
MKILINEEQFERLIEKNYETSNFLTKKVEKIREHVFESCVTVDGRYMVINDFVFDLKEQKDIGNLWESFDIFKTIFKNVNLENDDYKIIQENIINLPLVETNENLYLKQIKNIFLESILIEQDNFLTKGIKGVGSWVSDTAKNTVSGISDFITTSYEGVKKLGVAISEGQWMEVLELLKKGTLYVFRKLKEALYSNLGMIVDAILIATGIGKGAQMVVWGSVLALDLYQIMTNDWPAEEKNKPMWAKFLDVGIDILGFTFAGVAAKGAKTFFGPLMRAGERGTEKAAAWVAKSPKATKLIENMIEGSKGVPKRLSQVSEYLSKKFPAGANFINKVMSGLSNLLNNFVKSMSSLLKFTSSKFKVVTGGAGKIGSGVRAAALTGGILAGSDMYAKGKSAEKESEMYDMLKNYGVKPDYSEIDV